LTVRYQAILAVIVCQIDKYFGWSPSFSLDTYFSKKLWSFNGFSFDPLAKLFLKVSPGFTWGYSHSTPTGLIFLKEQPQEPVAFTPGETWDNPDRG